jgi:hypothetical protein
VGGDLAGQLFCQARLTSLTDDVVQPGCDLVRCVVRIVMIRIAADMNHCGSRSAHLRTGAPNISTSGAGVQSRRLFRRHVAGCAHQRSGRRQMRIGFDPLG